MIKIVQYMCTHTTQKNPLHVTHSAGSIAYAKVPYFGIDIKFKSNTWLGWVVILASFQLLISIGYIIDY